MNTFRWITRIITVFVLAFGLLFYFGYGNPLPFIDASDTAYDTLWKIVFPIMFIGLIIGLWREKIGGYLVTVSLAVGFVVSMIISNGFGWHMLIPFLIGVIFLVIGYNEPKEPTKRSKR